MFASAQASSSHWGTGRSLFAFPASTAASKTASWQLVLASWLCAPEPSISNPRPPGPALENRRVDRNQPHNLVVLAHEMVLHSWLWAARSCRWCARGAGKIQATFPSGRSAATGEIDPPWRERTARGCRWVEEAGHASVLRAASAELAHRCPGSTTTGLATWLV